MTKTDRIIPMLGGANDSMIAREVGCSHELVRQIRARHGVESPAWHSSCRSNGVGREEQMASIIKLHKEGLPTKDIAERVGVCTYTVWHRLKECGLRSNKIRIRSRRKFTDEELVEALIKSGGNRSAAAKILGVVYESVYLRITRNPGKVDFPHKDMVRLGRKEIGDDHL